MSEIHCSAIIHPSAIIGDDCNIGPYCIIGENVTLKQGNRLHSHVVIDGLIENENTKVLNMNCDVFSLIVISERPKLNFQFRFRPKQQFRSSFGIGRDS